MDEVERFIKRFGDAQSDLAWKLDALLDLEHLRDPRIIPFLLKVLSDSAEPNAVRLAVLKEVRNGRLLPRERLRVARLMARLLGDRRSTDTDLRVQLALALGQFTDVEGVVAALGAVTAETTEPFDVRYAAFTSVQRAGPTPECVKLLARLSSDDTLGRSARSILVGWHLE